MNHFSVVFFMMGAIYSAPHIEAWLGNLFGFALACLGWYALWTEEKNK